MWWLRVQVIASWEVNAGVRVVMFWGRVSMGFVGGEGRMCLRRRLI